MNLVNKFKNKLKSDGFFSAISKIINYLIILIKNFINPFSYGIAKNNYIFVSRHPHAYKNTHSEFNLLFNKFTANNHLNNAGDSVRLWSFILNIKQVLSENIEGDFAELGVWRGNTASILAYFAKKSNRHAILFDTYEGFNKKDLTGIDESKTLAFSDTSIEMVKKLIGNDSSACEFVKGYFPESILDTHKLKKYAVVSLDCDLYEPMKAGLSFFYPLMPPGALFLLHDYGSWDGANKAINEFCAYSKEKIILIPDQSGSAFIRVSNKPFFDGLHESSNVDPITPPLTSSQ